MEKILIVRENYNPTIDYFIMPYIYENNYSVDIKMLRDFKSNVILTQYNAIIIIRYISSDALDLLKKFNKKIIYFIDDDLFDIRSLKGLPLKYQLKIFNLSYRHKKRILNIIDELWVSTDFLKRKYSMYNPKIINPAFVEPKKMIKIFYHGTTSHIAEIKWLRDIIKQIQKKHSNTLFEIFGTHEVKKYYLGIDRVVVINPLNWNTYLAYTSTVEQAIGLVPLLDTPFNEARGITKFFDVTRMNAIGIYSDTKPYRDFIKDNDTGLLIENDKQLWGDAISSLIDNCDKRARLLNNAKNYLTNMGQSYVNPFSE